MVIDPLQCLYQRRDYLTERIAAKARVEYDVEYDTRERDSLVWAIERLGEQHEEIVALQERIDRVVARAEAAEAQYVAADSALEVARG